MKGLTGLHRMATATGASRFATHVRTVGRVQQVVIEDPVGRPVFQVDVEVERDADQLRPSEILRRDLWVSAEVAELLVDLLNGRVVVVPAGGANPDGAGPAKPHGSR